MLLGAAAQIPRQQFVDPVDRMLPDALNEFPQIRLGIDAIELGRFHHTVEGGSAFAPSFKPLNR